MERKSGIYRALSSWSPEAVEFFRNSPSIGICASSEPREARFSGQLWQAFNENGLTLSRHAMVSPVEPGNRWMIRDEKNDRVFSVRQGKTGLDVYSDYDPRIRPWYRARLAVTAWRGPNTPTGTGQGKLLFSLGKISRVRLAEKVSPSLARAFEDNQFLLKVKQPDCSGGEWRGGGYWMRMRNNYEINERRTTS